MTIRVVHWTISEMRILPITLVCKEKMLLSILMESAMCLHSNMQEQIFLSTNANYQLCTL